MTLPLDIRPPAQAIDPAHLAFLDSLKSDEFAHTGRQARDHLVGVHAVLAAWGCPADVTSAGLFHNIYGTESFKPQAVDPGRRDEVAAVIGPEAERLAWLFCVCRRLSFFAHQDAASPTVWDEVHRCRVAVTPAQLEALVDIEAANLVEQYDAALLAHGERAARAVAVVEWMLAQAHAPMSRAARQALQALLARIRADQAAHAPAT